MIYAKKYFLFVLLKFISTLFFHGNTTCIAESQAQNQNFGKVIPTLVTAPLANDTIMLKRNGVWQYAFPAVMMGLKGILKPLKSGKVQVLITLDVANSIAADGTILSVAYGTGSAPNTNAAFTGTGAGGTVVLQRVETANSLKPLTVQTFIQNLTVNTTYWFDLVMSCYNGGISTFSNINMSLIEQ